MDRPRIGRRTAHQQVGLAVEERFDPPGRHALKSIITRRRRQVVQVGFAEYGGGSGHLCELVSEQHEPHHRLGGQGRKREGLASQAVHRPSRAAACGYQPRIVLHVWRIGGRESSPARCRSWPSSRSPSRSAGRSGFRVRSSRPRPQSFRSGLACTAQHRRHRGASLRAGPSRG
jgi:hypothetical protein